MDFYLLVNVEIHIHPATTKHSTYLISTVVLPKVWFGVNAIIKKIKRDTFFPQTAIINKRNS